LEIIQTALPRNQHDDTFPAGISRHRFPGLKTRPKTKEKKILGSLTIPIMALPVVTQSFRMFQQNLQAPPRRTTIPKWKL